MPFEPLHLPTLLLVTAVVVGFSGFVLLLLMQHRQASQAMAYWGSAMLAGAAGLLLMAAGDVPALAADVQDTTGAGDAFCGGVLAGLVAGEGPVRAAAMGTVSAAFVIEAVGALATERPSAPQRDARLAVALAGITHEERRRR